MSDKVQPEPKPSAPNDDDCKADDQQPLQPQPQPKKQKRLYIPPKADSDTFGSQQAFLDSLNPIAIDEVHENSLKCPICWKPYGEMADPGFDNTEQPVKLRCNHVFGDKCLKSTFGILDTSSFQLRPLSFSSQPNSMGSTLGQKLYAFAAKHGKNFRTDVETFTKMLEKSYEPRKGSELFGRYWWPIIQTLQHAGLGIDDVTFLDNAIILDSAPTKPSKHAIPGYASIQPESLSPTSIDMDKTFYEMTQGPWYPLAPPHYLPSMSAKAPSASAVAASALPNQSTVSPNYKTMTAYVANSTPFPEPIQASLSPTMPSKVTLSPFSSIGAPPAMVAASTQTFPSSTHIEQVQAETEDSALWKQALLGETNLDKLSALQKQAKQSHNQFAAQNAQILAHQEHLHAAREHHKRMQETQARMKRDLTKLLAQRLATIFASYPGKHKVHHDHEETPLPRLRLIDTHVLIHAKDRDKVSIEISPPNAVSPFSDIDDEEVEEESELGDKVYVIKRSICDNCHKVDDENIKELAILETLWWRNDAKTPDGCPICHKVLFKKTSLRSRYPGAVPLDESDDGW